MRSAFLNVLWQFILQAFNVIIPLLTFKIVIGRISFSQFGDLALILVVINYAKLFIDFGFTIKGPVLFNESLKNDKTLIHDISNILFTKIFISFFVLLILLGVSIFIEIQILTVFLIVFLFAFNMNHYFNFKEKSKITTIISLFEKTQFLCLNYFFLNAQNYFKNYLLFLLLSSFIGAILSLYFVSKEEKINIFQIVIPKTKPNITRHLKLGHNQFLINSVNGLFTFSIIPIVTYLFGSFGAGIYASAEKVIKGCQLLVSPLVGGIQTYFLKNDSKKKLLFTLVFGIFIFSSLSLVVFYYSKEITNLIAHDESNIVSEIISILSISILTSFMFTFSNVILFNKYGYEAYLKYIFLFVGLIGIILLVFTNQTSLIYFAWEIFILELFILLYTSYLIIKKYSILF